MSEPNEKSLLSIVQVHSFLFQFFFNLKQNFLPYQKKDLPFIIFKVLILKSFFYFVCVIETGLLVAVILRVLIYLAVNFQVLPIFNYEIKC